MNAYVSIAQLGITIVMSFFRGMLRMQRRTSRDNKLIDSRDRVVGHELDWLAMKLVEDTAEDTKKDTNIDFEKSRKYRVKLARLTGHDSSKPKTSGSYQEWQDNQFTVRTKARELAKAICGAAEAFIGPSDKKADVKLEIEATMLNPQWESSSQKPIVLTLKPSGGFGTWRMDSEELESILGLWLWSFKINKNAEEEDRNRMRIVSAFRFDGERERSILEDMDMWLGKKAVELSEGTLNLCENNVRNPFTPWRRSEESGEYLSVGSLTGYLKPRQRFLGWNTVPPNTNSQQDYRGKIRVKIMPTRNKLLSDCSQELYAAMITSMKKDLPHEIDDLTPTEDAGRIQLDSAKISAAASSFTESGLGSRFDALLCIIPALRTQLRCPERKAIISPLVSVAMKY